MSVAAVILAAGLGKRMKSDKPKVLHEAAGKPLIRWVADAARGAGATKLVAVVGPEMTDGDRREHLAGFEIAVQYDRLGTGHAALQAVPLLGDAEEVFILCGDVPCIRASTLRMLREKRGDCGAAVLTMILDDPAAYGRIIRDGGNVTGIVEARDASPKEKMIREVNSGTYLFRREELVDGLSRLKNDNAQGEYYLTDVIGSISRVAGVVAADPDEMLGVNTPDELGAIAAILEKRQ